MKKNTAYILIIFFTVFSYPFLSLSQDISAEAVKSLTSQQKIFSKELPIEIEADSLFYDKELNTYVAEGSVRITHGKSIIKADKVFVDMNERMGRAEGDVSVTHENGDTIKSSSLNFDLDKESAIIINGSFFFNEESMTVESDEIKKIDSETYSTTNTMFTTCDCTGGKKPSWSFFAKRTKFKEEGMFRATHVFFRIKNIPIFYSPFFAVPIKTKRASGFLMPKFAYSKLRGFKLDNSFFINLGPSKDMTLFLDLESARGMGGGIEARYMASKKTMGEFDFYYFSEKDIDRVRSFRSNDVNLAYPNTAGFDRYRLTLEHRQKDLLSLDFRLSADIVSDDEYFVDFAKDEEERAREAVQSGVSLTKHFKKTVLIARASYYDNLFSEDDFEVFQKLPRLIINHDGSKVPFTPFYFAPYVEYVNFERRKDYEGQRLILSPRVFMPVNIFNYAEFNVDYKPMLIKYMDDNIKEYEKQRFVYEVKADLLTTLVKYFGKSENSLYRHSIRPKISYNYIPPIDKEREDTLNEYDSIENMKRKNEINYSLNMVVTGKYIEKEKKKTRYRDLLYFDISQSYNLLEKYEESFGLDGKEPYSDVNTELILRPTFGTVASFKAVFDPYEKYVKNHNSYVSLKDKRGDSILLTHTYVRGKDEFVGGTLTIKPFSNMSLKYGESRNITDDVVISKLYGMDIFGECWKLALSYKEKLEEEIVFLSLTLKGLGELFQTESRIN